MARQRQKRFLLARTRINNGQDDADLVVDWDPTGEPVVHTINRTQRRLDRLQRMRAIDRDQHEAGTRLRDAWETAGLCVPQMKARGFDMPVGTPVGHETEIVRDEAAWQRYSRALAALPRDERRVAVAVAIYDEDPAAWGRRWNCDGLAMLRRVLDRLAAHWGQRDRPRASAVPLAAE